MTDMERLQALQAEIGRLSGALEALTQEAASIGEIIHCAAWHQECKCTELVRPEAGLPRGWLQKIDHCSGYDSYYCPLHWDSACLDDTDYWFSGGESIRLPFGKRRWWDEGRWRRIKKKFGAK